ncbi:uncharacterized protein ASCRUDRAFT_78331 [Ascoidea rubescens DSM 1968]|uniref:Abscisic acid G-protein coupled receptor-like domain-containing protein n=1 Tax=Ascoidea rubescens DSM 1968 TaxID=1344418 RepID=A0A1D2V8B0_9ASCO|nr:hypothetical protein ASCRUDRAFT_78331 [Ascoidea rubescens DSM 1968]ODV57879.1 hypothetical protein ASCRUDRAFT_78331 [Ascoidea rubescens DSM 1968]
MSPYLNPLSNNQNNYHQRKISIDRKSSQNNTNNIQNKIFSKINIFNYKTKNQISNDQIQINELQLEIKTLSSLKNNLYYDIANILQKIDQLKFDQTLLGKLILLGKKIFSVYCVYRLISIFFIKLPNQIYKNYYSTLDPESTSSIDDNVHNNNNNDQIIQDALAVSLSKIIISLFNLKTVDENLLSNQIGFLLSTGLFCCSFSSVLNTFVSFSKLLPIKIKNSSNELNNDNDNAKKSEKISKGYNDDDENQQSLLSISRNLVVAELTGIYVLATSLMIRSNLSKSLSNAITKIFKIPLNVLLLDELFDKVFAISVVITIILLQIEKSFNNLKYNFFDNDDKFMEMKTNYNEFFYDEENIIENNIKM